MRLQGSWPNNTDIQRLEKLTTVEAFKAISAETSLQEPGLELLVQHHIEAQDLHGTLCHRGPHTMQVKLSLKAHAVVHIVWPRFYHLSSITAGNLST